MFTRRLKGGGDIEFLYAIFSKDFEKVKYEIEQGTDVNAADEYGWTPLHLAFKNGNLAIIKLLIENGADVNAATSEGSTVLMKAAYDNQLEAAKLLIENGADLNAVDEMGQTALIHASEVSLEIVKLLIKNGANPNVVDKDGNTSLIIASEGGRLQTIKFLIENGANVNVANKKGITPLLGFSRKSKLLSPLLDMQLFIEKGADVNAADKHGWTPLLWVSKNGNLTNVKILIENGANVNAASKHKKTALMLASNEGHIKIVKLLIENGANVNAANHEGNTPLMLASVMAKLDIVKLLIENGANENAVNKHGETALNLAATAEVRDYLRGRKISKPRNTTTLWDGFTQSDLTKLDTIFENNAREYSTCPVCLKYVNLKEACNFVNHDCSEESYYNEHLYNTYKNDNNKICWCVVCGRISHGHRHYKLASAGSALPELEAAGDPFIPDCKGAGGGGLQEKVARFRQLRESALELEGEVGKKTKDAALNKLVEDVWNAPLHSNNTVLKSITNTKKWNINIGRFRPNVQPNAVINVNAPNIPFNGELPTEKIGRNNATHEENIPVIVFHHKQKNGTVDDHGIAVETLEEFIKNSSKNFGDESFGHCFMGAACDANLHPEEIKGRVSAEIYTDYKKKFNKKFMAQVGGSESIFTEARGVLCSLPNRAGGTRKIRVKKCKTRRNRH